MPKTVGLISLGCPKNLVDSEIMLGLLKESGYKIVTDPSKADIIIINTCGFIEDAKRESIETIIEMAKYKEDALAKYVIVTGCLTQRYKEELVDLFPEVDLFIGTGEYQRIVELIQRLTKTKKGSKKRAVKQYIGVPEYIHTAKTPRLVSTTKHAAYIKIAEGCFHGCSFCTIPKMRGRYRSRRPDDIVQEAKQLVSNGAKEINLIAQDSTAYGRDLHGKDNIVTLVERLGQISGEKWIRLMYAYPQTFKKGLLRQMKAATGLCKYIDIPIQHIDNGILEKMGRGRSEKKIRDIIDSMKGEVPEIAIRTSIIVGFPGETEKQFQKLLDYISEGYFDHVGVFTYSEEDGTRSARLKGQLPEKVKNARLDAVMKIQKKISRKKLKSHIGKRLNILVEGFSNETDYLLQGRSEFQAPEIDGVVYINEGKALPGCFYWVEITDSYDYDLLGGVV